MQSAHVDATFEVMRRLLSILVACGWCLVVTLLAGVGAQAKEKVCLCHAPPGNPGNAHTICVGAPATRAHLRHGDTLGECRVACGGDAGDTCGENQFCRREAGTCAKDVGGVCTALPRHVPSP